jgi:hypothetical protein
MSDDDDDDDLDINSMIDLSSSSFPAVTLSTIKKLQQQQIEENVYNNQVDFSLSSSGFFFIITYQLF